MMCSNIPDCQRAAEEPAPSPFTSSPSSERHMSAISAVGQPDHDRLLVRDLPSTTGAVSPEESHRPEPQGNHRRRYARRNGFCHFDLLRSAVLATIETAEEESPYPEMDDSQTSSLYARQRGGGQRRHSSLETPSLTPRRVSSISESNSNIGGGSIRRTRKVVSMEEGDSFFHSDDDECALYDDDANCTPCSARRVLRRT